MTGGDGWVRIRIIKGFGWYANEVGQEFEVIRVQSNRSGQKEYIVWESQNGDYNWVDEEDCELISTEGGKP